MNYFYAFNKSEYIKGKNRLPGCILCQIRDKNPSIVDLTVYSDDLFFVCINLYPFNTGHLLIFPRQHKEDVREYTKNEEERLNQLTRIFLNLLDHMYNPHGYNMGYNMGLVAGGSISHLHYHIIPRYPNEIGISELIAGKRVLIEDPQVTKEKIISCLLQEPFQSSLPKV